MPEITAVLGPTNTGKTHYAVERMLSYRSGIMGFPLRLLAREIYDRVVRLKGPRVIALITGEEKIIPQGAQYFLCTVESMPLNRGADFLAIDEIQLCADLERGHVFTDRLLHARGLQETLFLGAATMRGIIARLVPEARFMQRERLSKLSYVGSKKVSRLPERSAIVGFSADGVYAMAELIRRQKGGAAVVMGALSPRTRNAQVALFQNGDVGHLVATDAIGMGLNLNLKQVYFAGTRKFDGRKFRALTAGELGQIAGRAGRYMQDGGFGVTGEVPPFSGDMIACLENHHFMPVRALQWRNSRLDYASAQTLLASLEQPSPEEGLAKAREADDVLALKALMQDQVLLQQVKGRIAVELLWEVCQIPDFCKTGPGEHVALVRDIFDFLIGANGRIPETWLARRVQAVDRVEGDIDALSKRLAFIRTWTYVANRNAWLGDPVHWQSYTRSVEDRLSDALHERLTQRFVDRRTSVLMRRLKQKEALVAEVNQDGQVIIEGEFVGRIEGLKFHPDKDASGVHVKTLKQASAAPVTAELVKRVEKLYAAPDGEIDFTEQGGILWDNVVIGRMVKGADALAPTMIVFADELLEPPTIERAERRLSQWLERKIAATFEPLLALGNDEAISGMARGVAFQIVEHMGVMPRQAAAKDIKELDQDARGLLRKHGVRFGQHTIFNPILLKPAPSRLRLVLWGIWQDLDDIPAPPQAGVVSTPKVPDVPEGYYPMAGYRLAGGRALRVDMLERLADLLRSENSRAGFEATPDMLSITGLSLEQFADLMGGLGYKAVRGERLRARGTPESDVAGKVAPDADEDEGAPQTASKDVPAATQTVDAQADAPVKEPQATESGEAASEGADEPAPAETEAFYTFTYQPPRRKDQIGASGDGARQRTKAAAPDNRRPKAKSNKGKKPQKRDPNRPDYSSGPRREKQLDPDSPFAILRQLKDKS